MILYFFISYIIISTIFFLYLYSFKDRKKSVFFKNTAKFYDEAINNENLEIIKKIEEIKKIDSPWFEKLVSTLGVMVFITMSIGTSTQIYETYKKEKSLDELEEKYKNISANEKKINDFLNLATKQIIIKYDNGLLLDKHEKEILKIKLSLINPLSNSLISKEDIIKSFNMSMAIKEYEISQKIFDQNRKTIQDNSNIYDRIFLAEYLYHQDDLVGLENIIHTISENEVNPKSAIRYYALIYIANNRNDKYYTLLANKLGIKEEDAKNKIITYLENLKKIEKF